MYTSTRHTDSDLLDAPYVAGVSRMTERCVLVEGQRLDVLELARVAKPIGVRPVGLLDVLDALGVKERAAGGRGRRRRQCRLVLLLLLVALAIVEQTALRRRQRR